MFVGAWAGAVSPARRDTALVGVELKTGPGTAEAPLDPDFEHAVVVLDGAVEIDGTPVTPGHLAYVGPGRQELALTTAEEALVILVGGTPFGSPVVMWWNFVGRSQAEMTTATDDWNSGAERFGETGSAMPRIPAPVPPGASRTQRRTQPRTQPRTARQGAATEVERGRSEEDWPTDRV